MVKVSVNYTGNLHCDATHGPSQSKIATDAPADNKGKGEAFSPTDLVATALGTCISTTMGIKAEELGVDLRGMKFTFHFRQIHRTAPCWNKPRLIVRCTKVCREKSAARPNFFGKANSQRLSSRAQWRDPAAKLKLTSSGFPRLRSG